MQYLNADDVLDKAQAFTSDQSAALRAKMLIWLNMAVNKVVHQRKWEFLKTTSEGMTITANVLTLPADYKEFIDITFSDGISRSYIESATTFTFEPEITEDDVTADLTYIKDVADMTDVNTATVFPISFRNALIFGILSFLYIYERDDQFAAFPGLFNDEIKALKKEDNRNQAQPEYSSSGYRKV